MEKYRDIFNKNGYVVIKNFFSEEDASKIEEYANELEKWEEQKYKWMIFFENNEEKIKSRLENFIYYHDDLKKFITTRVKDAVDDMYNKKMVLFKDKLNWKYGGGKAFKAHQDHPAWTDFEPDRYMTVALFANKTTIDNGCLEFGYRNSKITSLCKYNNNGQGELDSKVEQELNWKLEETTPRDLLFFDSFVPHRSDSNKTDSSRRIFFLTYNEEKFGNLYGEYLIKKRTCFPPNIERKHVVNMNGNKYNLADPIV